MGSAFVHLLITPALGAVLGREIEQMPSEFPVQFF
jgi:hypothetical protein